MKPLKGLKCILAALLILIPASVYAAHPLITDDTGTQGRGKFQLELNGEYGYDEEEGIKERHLEAAPILSYGAIDSLDVVLTVPYTYFKVENGFPETEDGLSDISLEAKWRFYGSNGLSLALKPGLTLPTGDEDKGLGTGKAAYSLTFIASKEVDPYEFHLNLRYHRNENKVDEREDLWYASLAAVAGASKNLKVVGNIGVERNPDRESDDHPAFLIAGLIYSLGEVFDLDFGIKAGLTEPETDITVLAGGTWRF